MPEVYGRLYRGSSERRPHAGKINSVQSATFLIDLNGGSSLNQHEDTTMNIIQGNAKEIDILDIELRLTASQAAALIQFHSGLLDSDFQGIEIANSVLKGYTIQGVEALITALDKGG